MKKATRMIALLLTGVLMVSCLAGCGKKQTGKGKEGQSATDIQIACISAGLGTKWLDAVIEEFEKEYPEYNVYYNSSASHDSLYASFGLPKVDTVDLYIGKKIFDTTYLEPLNEVLDATAPGESKTIKEKFNPAYLRMEEMDGNYYHLTAGGGISGFVYNKEVFKKAGIETLPRTTDELALVCGILYDKKITPLCHYKEIGYYYHAQEVWFSQYEGLEGYLNFYKNPTKESLKAEDGRYEAIKVFEKIVTPNYTLTGSNSESHITMQTKFLDGQCAMMYTGSWLSNEMQRSEKVENFAMMKTPVISSIKDKLTTVKSDAELRKLITAIDNVADGIESVDTYKNGNDYEVDGKIVSAKDWEYVKAARYTYSCSYGGDPAVIPNYSNAKEGAKEFLKFLYSDKGYQVAVQEHRSLLPLSLDSGEIDTSKWNGFEKEVSKNFANIENFISDAIMSKHRLFKDGGASAFVLYNVPSRMCSNSELDRISAKQAWQEITLEIDEKYDTWINNIK